MRGRIDEFLALTGQVLIGCDSGHFRIDRYKEQDKLEEEAEVFKVYDLNPGIQEDQVRVMRSRTGLK